MKPGRTTAAPPPPAEAPAPAAPAVPFFRRADWAAFWTVFAVSFGVYFHTLAPTVTLEDCGELAVASDYLGVPHPPGYPIWTLATWFFQWIFHWVKYYGQPDSSWALVARSFADLFTPGSAGHPNPAWSVGLCSAFFGAMACAVLAMLVSRSGADMLRGVRRFTDVLGESTETLFCWVGGVAGGLILAFSPVLWSQSVIVEVYALNAFFQVLVILFLYRWMARPKDVRWLYWMAFAFGLGVTNHQTLLFLALALVAGVLVRDRDLFRDFVIVGAGLAALVAVNIWATETDHQAWKWTQGPGSPAFWIYSVLAVAIPVAGAFLLPRGRTVCWTVLLLELGLSFYLYLGFAAEQNPPMNWAYPRTWEGFLHAVGRGQYERIRPMDVFSFYFVEQVGIYLQDLRRQFGLPILLAGLLPFAAWRVNAGGRRLSAFHPALALSAAAVLLSLLEEALRRQGLPAGDLSVRGVIWAYRLLTALVAVIGAAGLFSAVAAYLRSLSRSAAALDRPDRWTALALLGLAAVIVAFAARWAVVAIGGYLLLLAVVDRLLSRPRGDDAGPFLAAGLLGAAALGLVHIDLQILRHVFTPGLSGIERGALFAFLVATHAFAGLVAALTRRPWEMDLEVSPEHQRWLLATMAGFVAVSIIFLTILNNAMDVQTQFIGRVQFIQSHAVYALWLGYGVVFAAIFVEMLARGRRWARTVVAAAGLLTPGLLLWKNAFDDQHIALFGGAEQNGHDFGWQYGSWQLEGAPAILRDLDPAERAAYPDPDYPPPMEKDAIFFGGTDPGRFVPTYMIYSADVRPDVYLITQNALADGMYMNVMRDLYGDRIWIPSAVDSNLAFQQYVEQIRSGQIQAGADVSFKDNRVSVQGVGGVMQINGLLCKAIFDRNKFRHAFYVEESYIIAWMYPYLEPHGLIMKINAEPIELTPAAIRRDRAFWDWYSRRLLDNRRFTRDIVARKTFSKLRSAIAGIYTHRGLFAEAEYAFRQSIALYPLSPEANFRLAEVYLKQNRIDAAIEVIENLGRQDPHNDKVADFARQLHGMARVQARIGELERVKATGRVPIEQALELTELYARSLAARPLEEMVASFCAQADTPASVLVRVGQICFDARRADLLERVLRTLTQRQPGDIRAWIDLAAVQVNLNRMDDALASIHSAIEHGGEPVRDHLRTDARFQALRMSPEFQRLVPPVGPARSPLVPDSLKGILR